MKKLTFKELEFSRQFILSPHKLSVPGSWSQLRIEKNYLSCHQLLNVVQVKDLVLLGYVIDPYEPLKSNEEILESLSNELNNLESFFNAVEKLTGRFVFIIKLEGEYVVIGDATHSRPILYYKSQVNHDLWIGSTTKILSKYIELEKSDNYDSFVNSNYYKNNINECWWPGENSDCKNVKRLFPNFYLDLSKVESIRYWPKKDLQEYSFDEAVKLGQKILEGSMVGANERFKLAFGVTCGLDSRIILAASKKIKNEILYFTNKHQDMSRSHPDLSVTKKMLAGLKGKYRVYSLNTKVPETFLDLVKNNVSFSRLRKVTAAWSALHCFENKYTVISGNIWEVVRLYYGDKKIKEITAIDLAKLEKMDDLKFAVDAFEQWLTKYAETCGHLESINVLDIFYWEHRLAFWAGQTWVECDASREMFLPYNNSFLLRAFLSVDKKYREHKSDELFHSLIKTMWPEAFNYPINPKDYPFSARVKDFLKRKLKIAD